jgi:hypothetical protein
MALKSNLRSVRDSGYQNDCPEAVRRFERPFSDMSLAGFASTIFEFGVAKRPLGPAVIWVLSAAYPRSATRPAISHLSSSKLLGTDEIQLPHLKESLRDCIKRVSDLGAFAKADF